MPQRSSDRPTPQRIRIVGGSLRGSKLDVIDLPGLRPTPDRIRETLFNWLAPTIEGMRCLDLFAGTGALGIEACSRGARSCTFVERDPNAAAAITANLERLKVANGKVVQRDALAWLGNDPEPFDLVFLDPPFSINAWAMAAERLEAGGWLADHSTIYVESPADTVPTLPPNWQPHREGHGGDVRHALYRRLR